MSGKILTLKQEITAYSLKNRLGSGVLSSIARNLLGGDDEVPPPILFDLVTKDTKTPSSTSVAAVPKDLTEDQLQQLKDVMMLTSFINVSAMSYMYQTTFKGKTPDITTPDGAAEFVRAAANAKNLVATKSMGGFLSLNTSSARSFSKNTTSAELHLSFLTTLFDGFGFPASTMKELDSVLTSVNQTLADLQMSWADQSTTLDHMVFFYYFDSVMGIDVKIPKVRLYFLHIDQKSWTASVGKSHIIHFDFNMNFFDSIYEMDIDQTAKMREKIQALLTAMTGKNLDDLNKLLSPKTVNDDR